LLFLMVFSLFIYPKGSCWIFLKKIAQFLKKTQISQKIYITEVLRIGSRDSEQQRKALNTEQLVKKTFRIKLNKFFNGEENAILVEETL
jgi:hypothetical protein